MTAQVDDGRGRERPLRGWYVALASGLVAFVAWGIGFYQLGVFLSVFHQEYGWNLTALSLSATIFCLIVGMASLLLGPVIDRHGPQLVIVAGSLILSAGMLGIGQVHAIWHVFLVVFLLAAGFSCTSTLVLGAVISAWFVQRRAFVMTLTLMGAPLGTLLLVPLSSALLSHAGIVTSTIILAAIPIVLVLPVALTVLQNHPRAAGPQPDVDMERNDHTQTWTIRQALRSQTWWTITLAFACIMFGQVAFLVHQVNFLRPIVGTDSAALLVGVTGACGLLSRLLGGLGDRFPKHRLLTGYCAIQAVAFGMAATSSHIIPLALAAGIVGVAMGNVVALQPLMIAERFGLRSYGTLFGAASLLTQCGSALGIFLVGVLTDITGGYTLSFGLSGLLAFGAAGLALAAGRHRVPVQMVIVSRDTPIRSQR